MRVSRDFSEYQPWSGAVDTYDIIANADKLDALEDLLEVTLGECPEECEVNDLLGFDGDWVLDCLGLSEETEEDDEDEEDEEENEEEESTDECVADEEVEE